MPVIDLGGLRYPFKVLSSDEVDRIHASTLIVLERTGVKVKEEEAFDIFGRGGCEADRETGVVRIPQHLVKEAIARAPSTLTLRGRNRRFDVELGSGKLFGAIGGPTVYILDLETRELREARKADVADCERLINALDSLYCANVPSVCPSDVPHETMILHGLEAGLDVYEKHSRVVTESEAQMFGAIEMAGAVVGGEEELRRRPIISTLSETIAPLTFDVFQTRVLLNFARRGIPLGLLSHPIAGFTSPVTLAGTLVIGLAECLSMLVLAQLTAPRAPVALHAAGSTGDMRTGLNVSGSVERVLLEAAFAQVMSHYGLPTWFAAAGTESKVPDAQAAIEYLTSMMPRVLAGNVNHINFSPIGSQNAFSFGQVVIDNELMNIMGRILRGMEVSDATLAVDLIDEVGHGGHYLNKMHTLRHYEREHYIPRLFSREAIKDWVEAGSKDLWRRADEEARRILNEHQPERLDRDVRRELTEIVKRADKGARPRDT